MSGVVHELGHAQHGRVEIDVVSVNEDQHIPFIGRTFGERGIQPLGEVRLAAVEFRRANHEMFRRIGLAGIGFFDVADLVIRRHRHLTDRHLGQALA